MSLPSQQKVLYLPGANQDFILGTGEVHRPGPGELLVKTEAVAVNPIDWKIQAGLYPISFPAVGGVDAAGVVVAIGAGVTTHNVGDKV